MPRRAGGLIHETVCILLSGLVLSILAAFGVQAATAESKRVALVIGNSKYVNAVALPNPANDAHLIASTLRNAGFEAIEGVDQDNAGMHGLISKFTEESYNADLAVIFYAGHGMQVDGKNYLIPVDALTSPAYLKARTVQIDEFMAALPADPAVGIIILDACRDNPLARTLATALPKSRSLGAGLAPVDAKADGVGAGGVLIAYATDPGAVAFDGNGVDSPYSLALAKHLTEPGVEIQSALTRVRGDVTEATKVGSAHGTTHRWGARFSLASQRHKRRRRQSPMQPRRRPRPPLSRWPPIPHPGRSSNAFGMRPRKTTPFPITRRISTSSRAAASPRWQGSTSTS